MNLIDGKYTIGNVAKLLSVSPGTLRHYEEKGLISPMSKTIAGYRLYNERDINQIRFIKQAQAHGLKLSEIKELLVLKQKGSSNCQDVHALMIKKKQGIEQRLTTLYATLNALTGLIEKCEGNKEERIKDCLIMYELENNQNAEN